MTPREPDSPRTAMEALFDTGIPVDGVSSRSSKKAGPSLCEKCGKATSIEGLSLRARMRGDIRRLCNCSGYAEWVGQILNAELKRALEEAGIPLPKAKAEESSWHRVISRNYIIGRG